MNRIKKISAVSLLLIMSLTLFACKEKNEEVAEDGAKNDAVVEIDKEQEFEMPSEEGDVIFVYSWNDEVGDRLQYFRELYPQYADRVEYVNLELGSTSADYREIINEELEKGFKKSERYPSIIALDENVALDYIESDQTLSMSEIGLGGKAFENMYPYTLDFATYEDNVKALTWKAVPGVVCYRTDIAEEVLGTSDPIEVQEALSDWDKFFETAEKMKAAGYKMVSGPSDVKYPLMDAKQSPWVTEDKLNIDNWVVQYLSTAKKLYDEDFTNKTTVESDAWYSDMDKDVFCYFGNSEFFYWALNPETHLNDYNICEGPSPYHFGGTYLSVTKECPDTVLASLVLRTLCCDTETMKNMGETTFDFVNNKAAVQEMIKEGIGTSEKCDDENPLVTFHTVAEKVDVSNASSYDLQCNYFVDKASAEFNADKVADLDGAIEIIKNLVKETYDDIKVEESAE